MLKIPEHIFKNIPTNVSQIIVVKHLSGIEASVGLYQQQEAIWQPFRPSFKAVIGKNGVANIGKKKEGDLKTPAGLYPIGEAFGTQPLALKMDYRYITEDDKFIDDADSKDYNSWAIGQTVAKSYEAMLIETYELGVVIKYNMYPTIAHAGSAIFIHLWESPSTPTSGCIALDKKSLLSILQWLDKKQRPYILIY